MTRRLLLALLALLGLLAAPALARTYSIDVPGVLEDTVAEVKAQTDVPVLLPSRLRAERRRVYPSGGGQAGGYDLSLAYARDCGGANACFFAAFTAERGGTPAFKRTVRLTGGRTGYFKPLTCGASCSPPMVQWVEADVLYSIQAGIGTKRTERRLMIRAANSAIRNGPR